LRPENGPKTGMGGYFGHDVLLGKNFNEVNNMAETDVKTAKAGDDNIMAAVAYLFSFITGIIIYLMYKDKKNKFVLFHAMQSIIFGAAIFAIFILLGIAGVVLAMIPVIGWIVGLVMIPVWLVLALGSFALWIFLMYKAYSGVKFKIPMVGDFAEKQVG
jgi:uncharacterized membrane protein